MALSSIKTCITCRPAPTASANRPSFTVPVSSLIATLTTSGMTISFIAARAASVW